MLVLKKIFQYYFLAFVFIIFSHSTNNGISSKENDFLVSFDKVKLVEKKNETDLDEIIVSNSPFLLRLTFKGKEAFEDNLQKIVKLGLDNFNYKFAGKSFQTISTNGVIQKSTSIDFSLTSKKDGTCKLGPFNLSTKDQNYYWPAVKVTVKKEEQSYCFAKQELNLKNLYVGQKGLLAIKCYFDPKKVMANTINVNFSRPQDLETKYINSEDTSEVIDGKEYLVKKYFVSLISNVPGIHTIPCHEIVFQEIEEKDLSSASRQDELENFFFGFLQDRGTTKFIRTNNINIEVKPIPISDDEAISTIGEFSALELRLSSKKCRQSEPVTIKLSLTGNSTFEAITHPELSLPEFIKHYESKSDFHSSSKTNGQGFGTKEFEYILQIDSSGEINIPQQHFKYFDPSVGKFKTISSNSAKIFVEGDTLISGEGKAEPLKVNLDQSKDQEVINIKKHEEEFKFKNIKNEKLSNPFFAAHNKIPDFFFWIFFLASGFLAFWLLISSLIIKTYQKRYILSRTISILKQSGLKKDWVLFYKSILLYFSCKLNFDGPMMDSELIIIRLRKKNNLAAKTIEEFLSFINQCQEISFGFKKLTSTEEQALIVSAQKWIKQFDSFFKKNVFKSE